MTINAFIKTPPVLPKVCLYCAPPPLAPSLSYSTKSSLPSISFKAHHNTILLDQQKKNDFIDRLVETSVEIIGSIWQQTEECHPVYSKRMNYQQQQQHRQEVKVVSTKAFIQEILRRSKTTYSSLQVCLFYLFRVKKSVVMHLNKIEIDGGEKKSKDDHMISCGRRMFLASLMLASKFLQDKNYRNRAWTRISGLALDEINAAELTFLKLINYNLYISKSTFDRWYSLLHSYLYRESSAMHSTCTLCYTQSSLPSAPPSPPTRDTSPCMIGCSQCIQSSRLYHPSSCYFERSSSTNLAYPSPPADEMNTASFVTDHTRYKRYNVDDDQGHLPSKRCCIEH